MKSDVRIFLHTKQLPFMIGKQVLPALEDLAGLVDGVTEILVLPHCLEIGLGLFGANDQGVLFARVDGLAVEFRLELERDSLLESFMSLNRFQVMHLALVQDLKLL